MNLRKSAVLFVLVVVNVFAAPPATLKFGNGSGGMKVITGLDAPVIIKEPDNAVGWGEMVWLRKQAQLVYPTTGAVPPKDPRDALQQLYPLDADTAFTCEASGWDFMVHPEAPVKNKWNYEPRKVTVYSLHDGNLTVSEDLDEAAKKYHLPANAAFLGCLDGLVFYWVGFDVRQVYWKTMKDETPHPILISSQIVDVFGVTRGLTKKYGFVVFRKSPGIMHYSPFTTALEEFEVRDRPAPRN